MQRSGRRSAAARSSSTVRASAKRFLPFVTSARTRSPGSAPATKTTKPSARATPRPPKARESISSSSSSPRRGARAAPLVPAAPSTYGSALRACLARRSSSLIRASRCFLPRLTSSLRSFSASVRVIRPRLTASSTTSWMRSRLSVTLCSRLSRNCWTLLSSPLVALLEALRLELDLLLPPLFFEPAFEVVFLLVLLPAFLAAFFDFDAAFLPLPLALAFAFDPDFAALDFELDDFDFEPALDLLLPLVALPAAFLSAI